MGKTVNLCILIAFLILRVSSQPLFAQEGELSDKEPKVEKIYNTDQSGDGVVKDVPAQGATDGKSPVLSENEGQEQQEVTIDKVGVKNKEKNEDLVSFNFLYYIIQKYKMSDIVEKR